MAEKPYPYRVLIGLETHVQLLTQTKLFCPAGVLFGMPPNSQTTEVSLGLPGVLPVLNRQAMELAIRAALVLHCDIASYTKWDRKQYFYPDLPKNYQISQYDQPFALNGYVEIPTPTGPKQVRLVRVHLEEDAGKNTHAEGGGDSLVDLNRAGTALLEIVSQPDMSTPEEAGEYLTILRTMMRDYDISDCEMQEGSLRCDANVNLHITKDGAVFKTPIVEIKNMNSIRSVERAIQYEIDRQYEHWLKTGEVFGKFAKQTRGWDENQQITRLQREKETESDYRYFPEPDLVPVVIESAWIEEIRTKLGENSEQRRQRYLDLGVSEYNANVLVEQGRGVSDYFEELVQLGIDPQTSAKWVVNDVLAKSSGRIKRKQDLAIAPTALAELIRLVLDGKMNLNDAREKALPAMIETGASAPAVADRLNLTVTTDLTEIEAVCAQVIADMPKVADDYRGGKEKAIGALMGQVMKRSGGKFPPALVTQVLQKKLTD